MIKGGIIFPPLKFAIRKYGEVNQHYKLDFIASYQLQIKHINIVSNFSFIYISKNFLQILVNEKTILLNRYMKILRINYNG